MNSSPHADTLSSLHTTLIDSRNGYEEALEDAKGKGLSGLFQQMIDMRQRHADELASQLLDLGIQPKDGSFLTSVHRTIIKVRSLFTDLGTSILPGLIDGEERILGYYQDAITASVSSASCAWTRGLLLFTVRFALSFSSALSYASWIVSNSSGSKQPLVSPMT